MNTQEHFRPAGEHLENVVGGQSTTTAAKEAAAATAEPENRPLSWKETAAAAGVLAMVTEESNLTEEPNLETPTEIGNAKKKTPKQYRLQLPKKKLEAKLSLSDKKNFKEGWNTDKARFMKRQLKYNRSQNFIILMEDNIHSVGSGSETAGMVMAFGMGPLKEKFMSEGIKYKSSEHYLHANAYDFTREHAKDNSDGGIEVAEDAAKEKEMSQDKEKSEKPKKRKKRAKS